MMRLQDHDSFGRAIAARMAMERMAMSPPLRAPLSASLSAPPAPPASLLPARLAVLGYASHQDTETRRPAILPPLCLVAGGESLMGADPRQDATALSEERPSHRVALATFWIARFPLTVAEYACFARAGGPRPRGWRRWRRQPDHPVVGVSWHALMAYAAWLMSMTRQPWRLPTEAEWEKAARWDPSLGAARAYPWGDCFDAARCNIKRGGPGATTPAGGYPAGASPCGAEELAGGVWEWTSSAFRPYPYQPYDGRELAFLGGARVLRGGSWCSDTWLVRASYRVRGYPWHSSDTIGGRLACGLPGAFEPAAALLSYAAV